jgi:VacB/RNase II family 3'-5' exoribonuclease
MLIEDLMLLANRKVAETLFKAGAALYPSVYRIHDLPNEEKLNNFIRIANQLGYVIDQSNRKKMAKSINKLLEDIEGKPEQNFLQSLAIRSMSKASYSPDNIGHYGLAFDYYTHFTSPIRRYPDLLIHRILESYIDKKPSTASYTDVTLRCKYCSEREINAEGAERASIKFKQVEFMQSFIGHVFEGVISGVIEKGFFVELLDNKCEGLVAAGSIIDDFYLFEEQNYLLKGYNTGRIFKLGQIVKVRIASVDLYKRTIDMTLS